MNYRPASSVACVPGRRYHLWSVVTAWGLGGRRVCEVQTCQRCGCRRERVVDGGNPRKGQAWRYYGAMGGDRG